MESRHSRAAPGFNGQNFIHTNPLPAVSNLPSFSYGSPQNTLPKQPTLRDTRLRMGDALQQADEAAKKRLEAAAAERKKAEEARRQGKEKEAEESAPAPAPTPRRTPRNRKVSDTPGPVRRSLRSQSVASATSRNGSDDERDRRSESVADFEGDATVNEIHNIINRAQKQPPVQPGVLRSRSINIHRSVSPEVSAKPRSAMKGSRDTTQKTPANARAKRNKQSQNDVDVTYNEEFNGMGDRTQSPGTPRAPAPLERIEENDSVSDGDNHTQEQPKNTLPKIFSLFGRGKSRDSNIYDQQGQSWFSSAKRNLVLMAYFLKHLLRSGIVITLFLLVISGIAWSLYNIRDIFPPLINRQNGFTVPANPPATYEELFSRLMDVERQLGRWTEIQQQDSVSWRSLSADEQRKREDLERELSSMGNILSKLSSVTGEFQQHKQAYLANEDATKTILSNVQASLAAMDQSVKGSAREAKLSQIESAAVNKQLSDLQGKIETVTENIKKLEFAHSLNQKALKTFEEALPQQLAVKIDPKTGKLSISPELWRHLQSLLRKDMEQYAGEKGGAPSSAAPVVNSWEDFLAKNEAKLRGYIGNMEEDRWRTAIADDVVISKSQMLKIMEEEMVSLRSEFEKDNQGLYAKIMADVKKATPKQQGGSASRYGDALIQAALHQYSATVLQKADYALLARGTKIIPHFTSSTYSPARSGAYGFFSSYWEPDANSPAHVLTESMNIGDCWTFPTPSGQVSLLLAEPIFPSDVTIDHVPKSLLGDGRSAPRDLEFWVRIDDDTAREQVRKAASAAIGDVTAPQPRGLVANNFVRIGSFTYDIDSAYPTQTFELLVDLQKLGVKVEDVSFRILNNWGNEEFTSLYRVRVHGSPAETRHEAAAEAL